MKQINYPEREVWEQRRLWFESVADKAQGEASYLVSEQACALAVDVQAAFCVGAWIGVIVLSMAVIDASFRENENPGFTGNTKNLLDSVSADQRFQSMRKRRNALVHLNLERPGITIDQQWENQEQLEEEAKTSVEMMFEAIFCNPGV